MPPIHHAEFPASFPALRRQAPFRIHDRPRESEAGLDRRGTDAAPTNIVSRRETRLVLSRRRRIRTARLGGRAPGENVHALRSSQERGFHRPPISHATGPLRHPRDMGNVDFHFAFVVRRRHLDRVPSRLRSENGNASHRRTDRAGILARTGANVGTPLLARGVRSMGLPFVRSRPRGSTRVVFGRPEPLDPIA